MNQSPPNAEGRTNAQGFRSTDPPDEQANPADQPGSDQSISKGQDAAPTGPTGTPSLPQKSPDAPASVDLSVLGEFTYYIPNSHQTGNNFREELPADFYEPTAEDLRSAQASLASRSRAAREAPLLTEKLRNERNQEIRAEFPTATIRIMFADRSMLEKTFPSSSVVKPVYAFVRSCLREDAKAFKFVLFETPPRRDLKVSDPNVKDRSLFDLHLAPRSILHFRFLEEDVQLDPATGPPPLYPEILSRAVELPLPAPPEVPSSPSARASPKGTALSTDSTEKGKKIAKLLRLQGKR